MRDEKEINVNWNDFSKMMLENIVPSKENEHIIEEWTRIDRKIKLDDLLEKEKI